MRYPCTETNVTHGVDNLALTENTGEESMAEMIAQASVQGYLAHKKPRPLRTLQ